MSNVGIKVSTAVNTANLAIMVDFGKKHLDMKTYSIVSKALSKIIAIIITVVIMNIIFGCILLSFCTYMDRKCYDDILAEYGAVKWKSGFRVSATEVMYTSGESYYYDTEQLNINMDKDFPGLRGPILLLDEDNKLVGILSPEEFDDGIDYFYYGIIIVLTVPVIVLVTLPIILMKLCTSGKIWHNFCLWFRTGDPNYLELINPNFSIH